MYDGDQHLFSLSEQAQADQLLPWYDEEPVFQIRVSVSIPVKSKQNDRLPRQSTSRQRFYQNLLSSATLTLNVRIICSIIVLFMWSRSRQAYYSPRRLPQRAITAPCFKAPHYRLIIDIRNGTCVGAEALLRWPGYGPVMRARVNLFR